MRKIVKLILLFNLLSTVDLKSQGRKSPVIIFSDSITSGVVRSIRFNISDTSGLSTDYSITANGKHRLFYLPPNFHTPFFIKVIDSGFVNRIYTFYSYRDTFFIPVNRISAYYELKGIEVSKFNTGITQNAKGTVLDLTKLKDAGRISVAEALERIPGFEIDPVSGNMSYMGKDISILKDGINVAGYADLVKSTLNINRANTYEKVTINLYDLKSGQPTISFDNPKFSNGISSSVSAMTGTNMSNISMPITISKNGHIISITPNLSAMYFPKIETKRETIRTGENMILKENVKQPTFINNSYGLGLGDNFNLNKRSTVDLSLNYKINGGNSKYNSHSIMSKEGEVFSKLNVLNHSYDPVLSNQDITANVAFIHKFPELENASSRIDLMLSYNYIQSDRKETIDYENSLDSVTTSYLSSSERKKNFNYIFTSLDYELNHKRMGSFEVVLKYFNRNLNDYSLNDFGKMNSQDSALLQKYRVNYSYGAALFSWDKSFKNLSIRLVLKQDFSVERSSIENGAPASRFKFNTFSPYITLLKNIPDGALRMEVQYVPTRPSINMLTNLTNFAEQYDREGYINMGNPDLKPSKSWQFSTLYSKSLQSVGLQVGVSYTSESDYISPYKIVSDSLIINTFRNIAINNKFRAYVRAITVPFIRTNVTVQANYSGSYFNPGDRSGNEYVGNLSFSCNTLYKLNPKVGISLRGQFLTGNDYQVERENLFSSGLGLSYTGNRFFINFSASNFHKPYNIIETVTSLDGVIRKSYSHQRLLNFSILFNYRLSRLLNQRTLSERKSIIQDDVKSN